MLDLRKSIEAVEQQLSEGTASSLTYAALECRLAIERICYERLRVSHDYISHEDLKRWQPRDILNKLIQEVDPNTASTFTFSIAKEPILQDAPPTQAEHEGMEYMKVGTQVGFNPNKLGKLWNALSHVALHTQLPETKHDNLPQYGDIDKIKTKVVDALAEIKRISQGTLLSSGFGGNLSFVCDCDTKNTRRLDLLREGQVISCINPKCNESYNFRKDGGSFQRRFFSVACKNCQTTTKFPQKMAEKLKTTQNIHFDCSGCQETVFLQWKLMQAQKS